MAWNDQAKVWEWILGRTDIRGVSAVLFAVSFYSILFCVIYFYHKFVGDSGKPLFNAFVVGDVCSSEPDYERCIHLQRTQTLAVYNASVDFFVTSRCIWLGNGCGNC